MYALLSGSLPFECADVENTFYKIMKGNFTQLDNVSKDAQDLLVRLLVLNPKQRLSIKDVLQHSFVKES